MTKLDVYTDGSHIKGKNYIGYGAVCMHQGRIYRMSGTCTQESFRKRYNTPDNVSNPTAELLAAVYSLESLSACSAPLHVQIIADYIGVREWNTGVWKTTKGYIGDLVGLAFLYASRIRQNGGMVSYRHIRGHQRGDSTDSVMNRHSDHAAKDDQGYNQFLKLALYISNNQTEN